MTLGKTTAFQTRAFAIMLVVMAGSATCGPASAQYYWGDRSSGGWGGWGWGGRSSGGWGDRYPSDRHYRRSPHRDFFSPFSGERRNRPAPAVDYSKAPPPRKLETPPGQTVVVIGDSMADWLGYGLDENYADQPDIGVERKIRATSGLTMRRMRRWIGHRQPRMHCRTKTRMPHAGAERQVAAARESSGPATAKW